MTEERNAKIAFVGCGYHATRCLYPVIHMIPQIDLVAVCDLKEDLAKRNARWFGARRWYTNVEQMLLDEDLDGAIIVGPPQMHSEVGKKCLEAGLPIFVEKPSAISCKEAEDLALYAEKKRLWGAVGFMKRYAVCYQTAKAIVDSEEFGEVTMLDVKFSNGPYSTLWGIKDEAQTFLIGQAVHAFDLVRFFGGEIKEIYALSHRFDANRFGYAVAGRFENDVHLVMNLNSLDAFNWKNDERLSLSGESCWLEVEDMMRLIYHPKSNPIAGPGTGRNQVIEWRPDWAETIAAKAEGEFGYRGELEGFARSCLGQDRPRADLWDGAKDLLVSEAVWQSANTGQAVDLRRIGR